MVMLAMAAMAVELATCRVEDAVYQQRGASSISATFVPVDSGADWPAHIALKMHVGDSGREYWWLPWDGGSSGQQHLASTTDVTAAGWRPSSPENGKARPLGDVSFIGMDASYNVIAPLLRPGELAPAHFHVPDLREALWYRTAPDKRDAESGQFFDLVRCARKTEKKAG